MVITFNGQHKSLKSFVSEPLNKFTVITGENGCGKSQLVELFDLKINPNKFGHLPFEFFIDPNYKKIQIEGIDSASFNSISSDAQKSQLKQLAQEIVLLGPNSKLLIHLLSQANIWIDEIDHKQIFEKIGDDVIARKDLENLIIESVREFDSNYLRTTRRFIDAWNYMRNRKFIAHKRKSILLAKFVASYRLKEITELSEADYFLTPIADDLLSEPDLFLTNVDSLFYNYVKRRDQNRRLFFDKVVDGRANQSISDDEFVLSKTPPWDTINSILESHDVKFRFQGIELKDFSPDANVSFHLRKTTSNVNVSFHYLSSGEKVIIGLIIKLFLASYYDENLEFPDLLVLDEPDAHLHPAMSKLLIDVLNDTFVNKLGMQVVMITHSPSTVALCPDDSIYELKNEPETSLKQISKDDALKILTGHLPTLSIDYKNHKQVFVESPTDIEYYQTVFNKLHEERNYPYRLYFISNSAGKGNCDQVIKIVGNIRESGNQTSYGIIDWDLKNPATDFVSVHGHGNRYSVENYLYDPIYITLLLMDLKAHDVYKELEISELSNHYSIGLEGDERLQKIADWFFSKFYEEHRIDDKLKKELKEIEYLNGRKVKVPKWYLEHQGHELEDKIKKVFKALDGRYTAEGKLQKDISIVMGKAYPLIPMDSVELIEELMRNK